MNSSFYNFLLRKFYLSQSVSWYFKIRHRPNSGLMGRFGFPWVPFRLNQNVQVYKIVRWLSLMHYYQKYRFILQCTELLWHWKSESMVIFPAFSAIIEVNLFQKQYCWNRFPSCFFHQHFNCWEIERKEIMRKRISKVKCWLEIAWKLSVALLNLKKDQFLIQKL